MKLFHGHALCAHGVVQSSEPPYAGFRAHLRQPKVLARERQNYDGHGYATALGYAEGRSALEDLNGQR